MEVVAGYHYAVCGKTGGALEFKRNSVLLKSFVPPAEGSKLHQRARRYSP
ncbi:MAG: hypothetical protein ACE5JA_04275 [bacterium]